MFESDNSSVASSYGEGDEMERFVNRCSICFDSHLDLCIEGCLDQFCIDCFQRYIIETVKSSWGLSVTLIRCPVCSECIPKHEWTKYVPQRIVDLYDKFNKPYRSFIRSCSHCETDVIPCSYQHPTEALSCQTSGQICSLLNTIVHKCEYKEHDKNHGEHIAVKRWISVYKRHDAAHLLQLYKNIMNDVTTFQKNHIKSKKNYANQISLSFMNLRTEPDIWKQNQFVHISFFPDMSCTKCHTSMCLLCGYDTHHGKTCQDNMINLSKTALKKDTRDTVKWKVKNSRQCPNCSIMINRDEGCNKVDCSYCGFSFCWACRSPWETGCGFYRCSVVLNNDVHSNKNSSNTSANTEEKTELGVPNMKNIQARIVYNRNN